MIAWIVTGEHLRRLTEPPVGGETKLSTRVKSISRPTSLLLLQHRLYLRACPTPPIEVRRPRTMATSLSFLSGRVHISETYRLSDAGEAVGVYHCEFGAKQALCLKSNHPGHFCHNCFAGGFSCISPSFFLLKLVCKYSSFCITHAQPYKRSCNLSPQDCRRAFYYHMCIASWQW